MDPFCPRCHEPLFVTELPLGGYEAMCLICGYKRVDPPAGLDTVSEVQRIRDRIIDGPGNGADMSRSGG